MSGPAPLPRDPRIAPGVELIELEAVLIDEQRWDAWLALFLPDCEYWIPAWKGDGTLTEDPQRELSNVYYSNRSGLEDRILRIRSGRSPASTPLPRTTHLVSHVFPTAAPEPERLQLRSSWTCQVYFPRPHTSHCFFGRSEYDLRRQDGAWRIARRKCVMLNDRLPTMFDIYCA